MVQDSLSNAIRHAKAKLVTVTIKPCHDPKDSSEAIKAAVADDGRGAVGKSRIGYRLTGNGSPHFPSRFGAMKILIVEDHPIVRTGLRRLLAAEAAEIREAASGEEAIDSCKSWQPSLVILDLNLPGMSGLALLGRLKTAMPETRVLVLSMHGDPMHATRALQTGAAGYVTKNAPP